MSIRFSAESLARVAKANKIEENGYALGWMVSSYTGGTDDVPFERWETLYAIKGDTIVMHKHKASNNFDHPLYKWTRVDSIPADAEFIGTYEMPTNIRK